MECTAKVFLLTGEWTDQDGQLTLTYYGRSPKLGPVEIIFENIQCCFFVPLEAELPELTVSFKKKKNELRTFQGKPVEALYFSTYSDMRNAYDRFKQAGVTVFEGDIKPHERFLMENFINGQLAVHGDAVKKERLVSFTNPQIKPCEVNTEFRIASVDIECGVESNRLYSIGAHISGAGEEKEICFMLGDSRESREGNLELFPSEQGVLNAFMEWFREEDPDIIIGWHVIGFDLVYLEKKCESFYMDLDISRNGRKPFFNSPPGGGHYATISGRVVLDGPPCMRDAGYTFDNFTLETVSQSLLNEGKIITATKEDKIAEIEDLFENDKDMLGKYNIQDCVLVTKVFNHVDMVKLMIGRVKASGLLLPNIGISNAAFDHMFIPRMHRLGFVAPANNDGNRQAAAQPPNIIANFGIYDNVCHFQLNGILSALTSAFKIDPLAKVRSEFEESCSSPGLMQFSKKSHILPLWLEEFEKSKQESKNSTFAKSLEITERMIINSLKSPMNRFNSYDLNAALEESVNWLLQEIKKYLEAEGYILCAGSINNLYIQMKPQEASTAMDQGDMLAGRIKKHIQALSEKDYAADLNVNITCLKHYQSFVMPENASFSKEPVEDVRFAAKSDDEQIELHGLKVSGADWTAVAATFQQGLYEALFTEENAEEWAKNFVTDLKAGEFDSQLVYTRKLVKAVDEYTGNLPPHVRAAKMLDKPGKFVKYLITSRGPVPQELDPKDIDYQHYLDKQLSPVGDAYFELKNQKFENLFKAQQLSLFDL